MPDNRPNILLFITDQHRGDCLGIEGHPVMQTPHLDHIAASGVRFASGYSACPVCIPARRTLMSGQKPRSHGVFMNHSTLLDGPTLPGELSRAGYQTHLVGKLHLHPQRKLYGFNSADWADSPRPGTDDDYQRFLRREGVNSPRASESHGMDGNGWAVRPWALEERFHFSNWCSSCALDFLERRDPTVPFFLKTSFFHPHQPLTPPQYYFDKYMNMELPVPYVGDWASVHDRPVRGLPLASWRTRLDPIVMKQFRAAYYASIEHIDHQIGRILRLLPNNTIIVFTSDHGEMLGDHQWIRKRNAFEASARIPFLMNFPNSMGVTQNAVREEVVELMDIMPTLLDAAAVPIPDSVDGKSLLPLLRGTSSAWRDYLHGECAAIPSLNSGMQYLTDGKRKYIWYPGTGQEQYFDLEADATEMYELSGDSNYSDEIFVWRKRLTKELADRPEGFVEDGKLKTIGGNSPAYLAV